MSDDTTKTTEKSDTTIFEDRGTAAKKVIGKVHQTVDTAPPPEPLPPKDDD